MSAEELRREYEEEQEKRRIQELIESWWATQEELDPKPPTPATARFPSHPPGFAPKTQDIGTSDRVLPAPRSPIYIPAVVATDQINQESLEAYWERKNAPIGLGPWYRLEGGHVRFRFGTPWSVIDREERMEARERANARLNGIPVPEEPPPKQGDEHILRVRPDPVPEPSNEEEEEEEGFDPGDDNSSDEGENLDQPAWSDTSTVTEEPTQVPSRLGMYLRRRGFRGSGRGRGR